MPSWIRWRWLFGGLFATLVASVFQNCGQAFRISDLSDLSQQGQELVPRGSGQPVGTTLIDVLSFTGNFQNEDPSLASGQLVDSCLTGGFDACIFWKNPSATKLLVDGSYLDETAEDDVYPLSTLASYQNFGVSVKSRMTGGQLRNSTFDVHYRTGTTKNYYTGQSGSFVVGLAASSAAALGAQRFGLEQIQTFFFLDSFRSFMTSKAGGFFAQGRNIAVNAVNLQIEGNAYYSPNDGTTPGGSIELGVRSGKSSRVYPFALSAEVGTHESNHANLDAANIALREADVDFIVAYPCPQSGKNYFITTAEAALADYDGYQGAVNSSCGSYDPEVIETMLYCKTGAGCLTAIDEGQADFFTMAYFLRAPSVGELSLTEEYVRYWRKRSTVTKSNVDSVFGMEFTDDFQKKKVSTSGEIHDMGEVISEILFDIYVDSGDRDAFLTTVSECLTRLNAASTFSTMKDQLLAIDASSFSGKNATLIRQKFEGRGY